MKLSIVGIFSINTLPLLSFLRICPPAMPVRLSFGSFKGLSCLPSFLPSVLPAADLLVCDCEGAPPDGRTDERAKRSLSRSLHPPSPPILLLLQLRNVRNSILIRKSGRFVRPRKRGTIAGDSFTHVGCGGSHLHSQWMA